MTTHELANELLNKSDRDLIVSIDLGELWMEKPMRSDFGFLLDTLGILKEIQSKL